MQCINNQQRISFIGSCNNQQSACLVRSDGDGGFIGVNNQLRISGDDGFVGISNQLAW
jgi:hypothetical protein